VQHGHGLDTAGEEQRPGADRAAALVTGDGHRVDAGAGERDRELADGLDRVGVEGDPVLVRDRGEGGDRLHGPHLVVRPHHAHQRDVIGVALDGGAERLRVEPPVLVHLEELDRGPLGVGEPAGRIEDRVVLDRADQDARPLARPEQPFDREVVRLGPARGEHHLARAGLQGVRDGLAGLLHHAACPAAG